MDTYSRLATWLHFRDKGFADRQAANLVRKYLFDYSRLTPLERGVVRRFILPFLSWTRFAIPRSVATIVEHPGAYAEYARIQNMLAEHNNVEQEDLPNYLEGAIVVDVDKDNRIVVFQPQMPWADLYGLTSDEAGPEIGRNALAMLHPAVASVISGFMNRDIRTGKTLVENEFLYENPIAARIVAALRFWVPTSEVSRLKIGEKVPALRSLEQLLGLTPSTEPRVYDRPESGVINPATASVGIYDKPLDEARAAQRTSRDLSTLLKESAKEEKVPEGLTKKELEEIAKTPDKEEAGRIITSAVSDEQRFQARAEETRKAWEDVVNTPVKAKILATMVRNSKLPKSTAEELVSMNPELWSMPEEDFRVVMAWLYSPENIAAVRVKVKRNPSYRDMIQQFDWLVNRQLGIEDTSTGTEELKDIDRMRLEGVFDYSGM